MPRSILFLCFYMTALSLQSQTAVFLELGDFARRPCIADSSRSVFHPSNWVAYATIDDQIGNPKDSSVCIDWTQNQITINGISGNSRPIYLEYIGEEKRLEANSAYALEDLQGDDLSSTNYIVAQYTIDLTYELTGVTRQLLIDQFNSNFDDLYVSSLCVLTEKMEDPLIDSYIATVDSDELQSRYTANLFGGFPSKGFFEFNSEIRDVLEVENDSSPNSYYPTFTSNFIPTLLAHRLPGIPGPNNLDTFYVKADFNPSGPDTATLNIYSQNDLLIQPFIDIAFENTADPNFTPPFEVNYFYDFCLPFRLVERTAAPGDGIVFSGGQPIFGHKTACIQLNESSYLEVAKQQRLWYGRNSAGMLVMKKNASIVLAPNSQMLFDGTLGLGLASDENANIKILNGAHLEFSEASSVSHLQNQMPAGQIKVELAGGTIDLSSLSETEKRYFQISAKENVKSSGDDFLTVWHQRSADRLTITPIRDIEGLTVNVYSLSGQLLSTQIEENLLEETTSTFNLPTNSPASLKAIQFITDNGEQQTITLLF